MRSYSFTNNFYLNVRDHQAGASSTVLPKQVNVSQSQFEHIALQQVAELWSNYGQLGEIWFDGGYGGDVGPAIKRLITRQKEAVGFGGSGVMDSPVGWIGTESGLPGGAPIWSTGSTKLGDPDSTVWMPKACDTTLQTGDTWFYEPGLPIRSLATMIEVYHQTVGRNGVLELDFAIDRTGQVAADHAKRYAELGQWIRDCYGTPVAEAQFGYNSTAIYTLSLPIGQTIDRVVLREDQKFGQRIRAWKVEAEIQGEWHLFGNGTGVGNRYVVLGAEIMAQQMRLTVTQAIAAPVMYQFAAFASKSCKAPSEITREHPL